MLQKGVKQKRKAAVILKGGLLLFIVLSYCGMNRIQVRAGEQNALPVFEVQKNNLNPDPEDPETGRALEQQRAYMQDMQIRGNTMYQHATKFANYKVCDMIDISAWQGEINWNSVKKSGVGYAIIRVGFRGYGNTGNLREDVKFSHNIRNAIAAGVKVGVYIFSQATTEKEAQEEADFCIKRIRAYQISLPIVMDYEYADVGSSIGGRLYQARLSKNKATTVCEAFCKRVKANGYTPMVYANRSMLSDSMYGKTLGQHYKIWLAEYTTKAKYTGNYQFWQYTKRGYVAGINGYVDRNFYYIPKGATAPSKPSKPSTVVPSKKKLSSGNMTLSKTSYTYDRKVKSPSVTINVGGKKLKKGVDYTLIYTNNQDAGKAVVTAKGKGNYEGTLKKTFFIHPAKLTADMVDLAVTDYLWDGKVKTPKVLGIYKKIYMKNKIDFQVFYPTGRKALGIYEVQILGKGNYEGEVCKQFRISAKKGYDYRIGGMLYQITSSTVQSTQGIGTVALTDSESRKLKTLIVKDYVTIGGRIYRVTEIGQDAFIGNRSLSNVVIGKNVQKIGKQAFYGCKNLKTIQIESMTLENIQENAIGKIYAKACIKVPQKRLTIYHTLLSRCKGYQKTVRITKK